MIKTERLDSIYKDLCMCEEEGRYREVCTVNNEILAFKKHINKAQMLLFYLGAQFKSHEAICKRMDKFSEADLTYIAHYFHILNAIPHKKIRLVKDVDKQTPLTTIKQYLIDTLNDRITAEMAYQGFIKEVFYSTGKLTVNAIATILQNEYKRALKVFYGAVIENEFLMYPNTHTNDYIRIMEEHMYDVSDFTKRKFMPNLNKLIPKPNSVPDFRSSAALIADIIMMAETYYSPIDLSPEEKGMLTELRRKMEDRNAITIQEIIRRGQFDIEAFRLNALRPRKNSIVIALNIQRYKRLAMSDLEYKALLGSLEMDFGIKAITNTERNLLSDSCIRLVSFVSSNLDLFKEDRPAQEYLDALRNFFSKEDYVYRTLYPIMLPHEIQIHKASYMVLNSLAILGVIFHDSDSEQNYIYEAKIKLTEATNKTVAQILLEEPLDEEEEEIEDYYLLY